MDRLTQEDVLKVFSKNIRHLRKKSGLKQDDFANQLGIGRSALGSYEEGRATPGLPILINISNVLDKSINDLLTTDISKEE